MQRYKGGRLQAKEGVLRQTLPSCETVLSVCGTWLQRPEQMNPHPTKGEVLSLFYR